MLYNLKDAEKLREFAIKNEGKTVYGFYYLGDDDICKRAMRPCLGKLKYVLSPGDVRGLLFFPLKENGEIDNEKRIHYTYCCFSDAENALFELADCFNDQIQKEIKRHKDEINRLEKLQMTVYDVLKKNKNLKKTEHLI